MQDMGLEFWLNSVGTRLPVLLVLLVGFIIALLRWKKHPALSVLVVVMFGLEALVVFPLSLFVALGPITFFRQLAIGTMPWIARFVSALSTAATTAMWVLVLVGLFGWRQTPEKVKPAPGEDGISR